MEKQMSAVVYTKTPKGLRETSGKTHDLSRDSRELLKACSGLFTIEEMSAHASADEREWIATAIADLVAEGYLRDVPEVSREDDKAMPDGNGMESLDFSGGAAKAAGEAEKQARLHEEARRRKEEERIRHDAQQAREEAAEKHRRQEEARRHKDEERNRHIAEQKALEEARKKARLEEEALRHKEEERIRRIAEQTALEEAREKARLEEEERARAAIREANAGMDAVAGKLRAGFADRRGQRDEATSELIRKMEEETRLKAEEKARLEAEERARREAEEKARREAEERARREAEERARREAEEKARREAIERARREAEEWARRQAEEKARREAEEKARREAEERARIEAEERARREAEEEVRRQAEEKARREAEEQARREAEERARIEAEERARREAEEEVRRQAEEKARREAEEQARREAEEKARIEAAEQARLHEEEERRRKEEELLRHIAEKKARKEAREKARLEEEERDREAIRERIRQRSETRRRVILPTVLGLLLPAALVLLLLHFFSFDGRRIEFERTAAELFGAPVKIGSARLSVLTGPQWVLGDVTTGTDAETVKIAQVRLGASWLGLFGTPVQFDSIHLDGPLLPPSIALKLLTRTSDNALLKSGELTATGLAFAGAQGMPPLNLRASWRDGRLTRISGQGEDAESGKVSLDMSREEQWQLALDATQLRWIFGPGLSLTNVALKADLKPGSILIRQFSGTLFDGELAGSGNIGWQDGWRAAAKLEAKGLDPTRFAPAWIQEGRVNGNAAIAAEAASPGELLSRARMGGSFNIGRGLLAGMNLDQVVQNRGMGDQSRFESLKGDFLSDFRSIEFSELRLVAGDLKANGTLNIGADRAASGRITIEVQTPGVRRTASVRIGGSLAAPQYQR